MEKMSLFHDSITDAMRDVIMAAGGFKAVGSLMFPEAPIDHAAGKVRDCLNPDRREKFSPDQLMMIVRLGRQHGCHALVNYIAHGGVYADPVPVEPEDEVARLQREFIEATRSLSAMAQRIEQLNTSAVRRVA